MTEKCLNFQAVRFCQRSYYLNVTFFSWFSMSEYFQSFFFVVVCLFKTNCHWIFPTFTTNLQSWRIYAKQMKTKGKFIYKSNYLITGILSWAAGILKCPQDSSSPDEMLVYKECLQPSVSRQNAPSFMDLNAEDINFIFFYFTHVCICSVCNCDYWCSDKYALNSFFYL